MKKNKLILLTILIVLAIYCGAVIFVTKPDSFAYDSLFRDIDVTVQVPNSEKAEADRADLLADVEKIAQQKADEAGRKAVKQAVAISNDNLDKAIQNAIEKYDAAISAMIDEAVKNALADVDSKIAAAIDSIPVVDVEAAKAEAVKAAVAEIESRLDEYATELEKALYEKYADQIIDVIDQRIAAALAEYEPAAATEMSEEEYNEIRKQTRETEINGLLQQLQNNN